MVLPEILLFANGILCKAFPLFLKKKKVHICVNMSRPSSCCNIPSRAAENTALFFIYLFVNPQEQCQTSFCGRQRLQELALGAVPVPCTAQEGRSLPALPDVTTLPGGLDR